MAKVVDNREVTKAVMVSIVISPNKIDQNVVDNKIVNTYFSTMNVRYSLQGLDGHLDYKNMVHESPYTDKPLTVAGVLAFVGSGYPDIKADDWRVI